MTSTARAGHGDNSPVGNIQPRVSEREFVLLMALISAMAALAIDMLLPAFAQMREEFSLAPDATDLSLTITLFFVGSGIGNLIYGPVADAWGRKPVLVASLALYGLAALAAAVATSLTWLLVARFVWGFAAGGPRVLTQAIVRDRFSGDAMARVMSMIQSAFFLGPIIAPLIGAGLVEIGSWRWVMAFGVITAIAAAVWSLRLRETLVAEHRRPLTASAIGGGVALVVRQRRTLLMTLSVTFLSGAFFSFLSSSELAFADVFNKAEWFVPYFSGMAVLLGITSLLVTRSLKRWPASRITVVAGTVLVVSAAVRLAVAASTSGIPPFVLWMFLFSVSNLCIVAMFPSLNSLALEPMGALAGTAASVIGFTTAVGGAMLATITDRSLGQSVMPFAVAYLVYGSISLTLLLLALRYPATAVEQADQDGESPGG